MKGKGMSVSGRASGGVGASASAGKRSTSKAAQASPHPVDMSGRKDKAPPSRTAKAEIKGYLSKVAREDRETEKSQYRDLDRAMKGTDAKATKADLAAARQDRMSKSSAPSRSPRSMPSPVRKAMGGMVGYKDGGCVAISGPGNQQVSGKKFSGNY